MQHCAFKVVLVIWRQATAPSPAPAPGLCEASFVLGQALQMVSCSSLVLETLPERRVLRGPGMLTLLVPGRWVVLIWVGHS